MNKRKAHSSVRETVRKGTLSKPSSCEICRLPFPVRSLAGHHFKGYEYPLEVLWLCQKCHTKQHWNGKQKLSELSVQKIKAEYTGKWGQLTELAGKYGMCVSSIRNIVVGITWK